MQYIGCHLTISKGFHAMGNQALEVGGTTAQFFTRNPRGGKAKDLDPEDIAAFQALRAAHHFGPFIAHAPYTINPCAAKPETLEFARMTMEDDLRRLDNLDIYVTGSNSRMLSSDILTEFRGRNDEIRVHPLSFAFQILSNR